MFTSPLVLSPEKGADTLLWLATAPEVAEVSGLYFVRRKPARSSRVSRDPAVARRLWEASEALTGPRATHRPDAGMLVSASGEGSA